MMSQEVEDVMKSQVAPLDVLRVRVPHCSMPAPEALQARITPAYHEDKGEAREQGSSFVGALAARQRYGYFDCSTCPERLIFDHLWLDETEYVPDSKAPSNPLRTSGRTLTAPSMKSGDGSPMWTSGAWLKKSKGKVSKRR